MGRLIYIPPDRSAPQARPQLPVTAEFPPDQPLNWLQFTSILRGTHEEIYIGLIQRFSRAFNGTISDWRAELEKLKNQPA